MPNLSLFILDPSLRLAPFGVPGEICVSGIGVGEGYWNQPEKTAAVFIANPVPGARGAVVYRTGDLGRWLPDGTIEFLGRLDQQVKIRGFRIEPGEVESALLKHEAVSEAVVLARPDGTGNRILVAYVVPEPGTAPSTAQLRSFLGESLPDYMVPSVFMTLDGDAIDSHRENRSEGASRY
jgi:acyl-CoA synthetase (AMP-forming)/AMP-acid ligase II